MQATSDSGLSSQRSEHRPRQWAGIKRVDHPPSQEHVMEMVEAVLRLNLTWQSSSIFPKCPPSSHTGRASHISINRHGFCFAWPGVGYGPRLRVRRGRLPYYPRAGAPEQHARNPGKGGSLLYRDCQRPVSSFIPSLPIRYMYPESQAHASLESSCRAQTLSPAGTDRAARR
jgi:hypothetical protein